VVWDAPPLYERRVLKVGESSTIVAFRALVMLACLVVAPLAAIFGSAFPDLVRSILVDPLLNRKNDLLGGAPQAGQAPFSPMQSTAAPTNAGATNGVGGNLATNGSPPPWQAPGALSPVSAPASPRSSGGFAPASAPVGAANDPLSSGSAAGPRPAPANLARFDSPAEPLVTNNATPSAYGAMRGPSSDSSAPRFAPPGAASPLPAASASRGPGDSELFSWFEKRLREAGATYYLLETWGNEGELYRFHCKMAVANNPNYTRHFEATDRDKLQAMSRVLEQVEAWRAGRLP
jgi:hypothetical protein